MRGLGRIDEAGFEILVNEVAEGSEFKLGERINVANRRNFVILRLDAEVEIAPMRRQRKGLLFAENIREVMVLARKTFKV